MSFLVSLRVDRRVSGGPGIWDWSCHFLVKEIVIQFGDISVLFRRGIRSNFGARVGKGGWRRITAKRRSGIGGRECRVCIGLVVESRLVSEPVMRPSMAVAVGMERKLSAVMHPVDIP